VAAVAGCSSRERDEEPSASTVDTTETPTCGAVSEQQIELVEAEDISSERGYSIEVTVDRKRVTPERTARVRVRLESTVDGLQTNFRDTEYCSFVGARGEPRRGSDPRGLWLYRQGDSPSPTGDCWTLDRSPSVTRTVERLTCESYDLHAGETVTTTDEVWDDYRSDGYFQPGTYRFGFPVPVSPEEPDESLPKEPDYWHFGLRVAE